MTTLSSTRTWEIEEHMRHIDDGQWGPMYDGKGNKLPGIQGKAGVRGQKADGTHIGCDFIKMQPGSKFPLHVHEGDHEIYFIEGVGRVHINGKDLTVIGGSMVHIPAEYPHGVWVPKEADQPLIFVAMGHPHQHVDSPKRSRSVPDKTEQVPEHYETPISHR